MAKMLVLNRLQNSYSFRIANIVCDANPGHHLLIACPNRLLSMYRVYPVTDRLATHGIPIGFLADQGVDGRLAQTSVFEKPIRSQVLQTMLGLTTNDATLWRPPHAYRIAGRWDRRRTARWLSAYQACRRGRAEKSRIHEQPCRVKGAMARTSFVVNVGDRSCLPEVRMWHVGAVAWDFYATRLARLCRRPLRRLVAAVSFG
jgi:hypothetical protein